MNMIAPIAGRAIYLTTLGIIHIIIHGYICMLYINIYHYIYILFFFQGIMKVYGPNLLLFITHSTVVENVEFYLLLCKLTCYKLPILIYLL